MRSVKFLFMSFLAVLFFASYVYGDATTKKVAVVIAPRGYQAIEYNAVKQALVGGGYEVTTVSVGRHGFGPRPHQNPNGPATDAQQQLHANHPHRPTSNQAVASDGSTTTIDLFVTTPEALDGFDSLILIGGEGARFLGVSIIQKAIKTAFEAGKIVGAICYSPRILAKAGILKDKKATGWDDGRLGKIFEKYGATFVIAPVVVDGNVITASGPEAAADFGTAIVEMLKGQQQAVLQPVQQPL